MGQVAGNQTSTPNESDHEIPRALNFLLHYETELNALLDLCATRQHANEGIPAILTIDDYTRLDKKTLIPAASDEGLGQFYADLSLALAVLVEARGGDPSYPSICPAMSAIAEWCFGIWPFDIWESYSDVATRDAAGSVPGEL